MKKVFAICLILSVLMLFCACNGNNNDDVDISGVETGGADAGNQETTAPSENVTIDWETPIDIDDSFLEETSSGNTTEPEESTAPGETQNGTTDPSEESAQDPTETVAGESTGDSVTEPTPSKPVNSSGAIELPMIPG